MTQDPVDFVVAEAALLDAGRFDDWLALFDEGGHYWVPLLGAAQTDPFSHNSIAYEDRLLLQLRVERLKNPRAHSLHPRVCCQHVLQRPSLQSQDGASGEVLLRTPFIYVEAQGLDQILLTGVCSHRLRPAQQGWTILQKRVDLLNSGQSLPAIQLFI
jgi:3-phenylpropionate/cinnamic acid dioxygenase small subunit